MLILTHFLAAMAGAALGVMTMCILAIAKDSDEREQSAPEAQ